MGPPLQKKINNTGDIMTHGEKAEKLFYEGYNCAQAVLLAFEDVTGLDKTTAATLTSSLGAGLGRMREVCGAVNGAAMVLGLVKGSSDPTDREAKEALYKLVQEFCARFKELNGSIVCRELLSGVKTTSGGVPEKRTDEYYKKRPCPMLVRQAAEIVEEILTC